MNHEVEKDVGELAYLRFFHKVACEMYSDGGTDEKFIIEEAYIEAGHTVPKVYAES